MSANIPTVEEWRHLYETVSHVRQLAPWQWMTETDLFGVQDPETNALGFVSVMGALGEHFAISVYLGPEGLYGFWGFKDAITPGSPQQLLDIPQLQVSFEDRDLLDQEDRGTIKKLGLRFRGKNAWPMFRSFRAGYLPWHLEAEEVRFLGHALSQLLDVAPRFKEDPSFLAVSDDDDVYLVRVPERRKDELQWQSRVLRVEPPAAAATVINLDKRVLEALRNFQQRDQRFEIDLFTAPMAIEEPGQRPFFPYILMAVESETGMVICHDLLQPIPSLPEMWGSVPGKLARDLMRAGVLPKEIAVSSHILMQMLQPVCDELHIQLSLTPTLPALNRAKELLLQHLTR